MANSLILLESYFSFIVSWNPQMEREGSHDLAVH